VGDHQTDPAGSPLHNLLSNPQVSRPLNPVVFLQSCRAASRVVVQQNGRARSLRHGHPLNHAGIPRRSQVVRHRLSPVHVHLYNLAYCLLRCLVLSRHVYRRCSRKVVQLVSHLSDLPVNRVKNPPHSPRCSQLHTPPRSLRIRRQYSRARVQQHSLAVSRVLYRRYNRRQARVHTRARCHRCSLPAGPAVSPAVGRAVSLLHCLARSRRRGPPCNLQWLRRNSRQTSQLRNRRVNRQPSRVLVRAPSQQAVLPKDLATSPLRSPAYILRCNQALDQLQRHRARQRASLQCSPPVSRVHNLVLDLAVNQ
jgi:hypothetical protein